MVLARRAISILMTNTLKETADLIFVNGSVHTMDERQPLAEAVAVKGNRIAAVGNSTEIRAWAGRGTRVVDAHRGTILPGFNDAHVHFLSGGFSLGNVDLRQAGSPEEMAELLAKHAANLPKGRWILGGDWDHERWPGGG